MTKTYDSLEPGTKYRVRYQIPGVYIRPREMVARFLGITLHDAHRDLDVFIFSGRPTFGTTELERRHLRGVWTADNEAICYAARKFNDGKRMM